MIVEHLQVIHVHINKCAGSSIERAFGFTHVDHRTVRHYLRDLGDEDFNRYFSLAVVRNPWDRYASLYHYKLQGGNSRREPIHGTGDYNLSEWVLRMRDLIPGKGWLPCLPWLVDKQDRIRVSHIAKMENINEEWPKIARKAGCEFPPLPHLNKSKRPKRLTYTQEAIDYIAELAKCDIDMFGYDYR